MQEFRQFVKGPIGKVLLVAIILPFVISAFYGYFTGGNQGTSVAEVNGTSIDKRTLDSRVRQYRRSMREQRPELDPQMLEQFINPGMVLEGLINQRLIVDYARRANLAVADEQAAQRIRSQSAFQDRQGQFSREIFERTVRGAGMNPASYMENLRQDIVGNQVRTGFQDTAFALPGELATQRRLGEQKRDLRYVITRPETLVDGYSVNEDEVREYYEHNREDFERPPRFKLAWVELSPEHYEDRVEITEQDIQREYEARKQTGSLQPGSAEGRQAAHIMLKTGDERSEDEAMARAVQLRERIGEGTSFADVARRHSEDSATADQGGELGRVRRADLPDAMAEALFSLKPGEVSQPVATDSGVHLVKRDESDRGEGKVPSLEEKRDEIARSLRQGELESMMADDASRLDQLAYEHTDLQSPAEKLDLEIRTTDWFALNNPSGIATNAAVREAMQTPEVREEGQNSELLELDDQRRVVIRLADQRPAEPRPLEQVADAIREQIKRERARNELDQRAEAVHKALDEGRSLDAIASELGLELRSANNVQRGAREPDRKLVEEAFTMPRPGEGVSGPELVRLADGGLAVVTVNNVTDGDPAGLTPQQQRQALARLGQQQGSQTLRSLMDWLRAEGDVNIKRDNLEEDVDGQGAPASGGQPRPPAPPGQ